MNQKVALGEAKRQIIFKSAVGWVGQLGAAVPLVIAPLVVATMVIATMAIATTAVASERQYITYSEFGAVGDGITDDFEAIIRAHAAANEAGLPVRADAGAVYYIGASTRTALIQTDTDWGDARFIIDNSRLAVEDRRSNVFHVSSPLPPVRITTIETLKRNQEKLDLTLPHDSFIIVTDNTVRHYIRYGPNQDSGQPQTDVFVIDKNGNVDMTAPIIWDFNNISRMTAYPIDPETLTVRGGHFTTIANQAESRYTYYARGIGITRSNVVIDGVIHAVTGELDHGAPYNGFIAISNCANVLIKNSQFSGRMTYTTIGSAGRPVSMGSYDITVNRSTNVTFKNCSQLNDIHDTRLWGIFASNYSKNITLDSVSFSRFDAHKGVANATIKNSVLGHRGMNIIGTGILLIENTRVYGPNFMYLRDDYGSTWEGEIIIRNSEFIPRSGARADTVLIGGRNTGQHDFGYTCFMPRKITIDGLIIHDTNPIDNYRGPRLFANFNPGLTSDAFVERYPFIITEEVEIRNLTIKSGKPLIISDNPFMFRNVRVTKE